MGLAETYSKSIWKQRAINAPYPPADSMNIGDVVEYHRGTYRPRTTLEDEGILKRLQGGTLPTRKGKRKSWSVNSERGVSVHIKVSGEVIPEADLSFLKKAGAVVAVEMAEKNSYLLSMSKIETEVVPNINALDDPIRHAFLSNDWDSKWIVVTEVWRPKHCTLLASSAGNASFELKAKGGAKQTGIGELDLSTNFSLVSATSDEDNITDDDGSVPLFRGHRWLWSLRPAGRRPGLLRAVDSATMESLKEDSDSLLGPLVPVPFDPTREP